MFLLYIYCLWGGHVSQWVWLDSSEYWMPIHKCTRDRRLRSVWKRMHCIPVERIANVLHLPMWFNSAVCLICQSLDWSILILRNKVSPELPKKSSLDLTHLSKYANQLSHTEKKELDDIFQYGRIWCDGLNNAYSNRSFRVKDKCKFRMKDKCK